MLAASKWIASQIPKLVAGIDTYSIDCSCLKIVVLVAKSHDAGNGLQRCSLVRSAPHKLDPLDDLRSEGICFNIFCELYRDIVFETTL